MAAKGIKNIELSGGTEWYPEICEDLIKLKKTEKLNFLLHNYFPPPIKNFVLNLASMNNEIHRISYDHIKNSLYLAAELSSTKFAIHAGFFIPISAAEIGKKISVSSIFDYKKSELRFWESYEELKVLAQSLGITLYIENNVISEENYKSFNQTVPFMLTGVEDYIKYINKDFSLLLDIAHLKVSSKTCGRSFKKECYELLTKTDYVHISDNDGLSDGNDPIIADSDLYRLLNNGILKNKSITLEIYSEWDEIEKSKKIVESLL